MISVRAFVNVYLFAHFQKAPNLNVIPGFGAFLPIKFDFGYTTKREHQRCLTNSQPLNVLIPVMLIFNQPSGEQYAHISFST